MDAASLRDRIGNLLNADSTTKGVLDELESTEVCGLSWADTPPTSFRLVRYVSDIIAKSEPCLYEKLSTYLWKRPLTLCVACLLTRDEQQLREWIDRSFVSLGGCECEQAVSFVLDAYQSIREGTPKAMQTKELQDLVGLLSSLPRNSGSSIATFRKRMGIKSWHDDRVVSLVWFAINQDAPMSAQVRRLLRGTAERGDATTTDWLEALSHASSVEDIRVEGLTLPQIMVAIHPNWQRLWTQQGWSVRRATTNTIRSIRQRWNPKLTQSVLNKSLNEVFTGI